MLSSQGIIAGSTVDARTKCWDQTHAQCLCAESQMFGSHHVSITARPMTQGHEGNKNYRVFNPMRSRSKRPEQMSMFQTKPLMTAGNNSKRFGSMQQ